MQGSRLQNRLQYDAKAAELRSLIETEAKKLQNITESKDIALRELKELTEKKTTLNHQIAVLESKNKEAEDHLAGMVEKENKTIDSLKAEWKKERARLEENQNLLISANKKLEALSGVVGEIEDFIQKESNARERYLEQHRKLVEVEEKQNKLALDITQKTQWLEEEKRSMDITKEYLKGLYGKLATYVVVAKETVEQVNEALKENVPLHFGSPGKVVQIDFDNFNKYL